MSNNYELYIVKGSEKKIVPEFLDFVVRSTKTMRKVLEDECTSHALYRMRLLANGTLVYLILSGSDEDGKLVSNMGFGIDIAKVLNGEGDCKPTLVSKDKKLIFVNTGKVITALSDLIFLIGKISAPLSCIDIPVNGNLTKGIVGESLTEREAAYVYIEDDPELSYMTM